jgi:uncharacterized protein (TIGR02246 family)
MRRWSAMLTLATAVALFGSAGCQKSLGLSEADKAAIRDAEATYARLMNARDFKGLAALYAEDATLLPPNRSAVQGRAAIQAYLESDSPLSNFQIQILELDGRMDLAYTREMVTFTLHSSGAAPSEGRSKVMAIWRKMADGSWKVLRDTWNADSGPDSSKQ